MTSAARLKAGLQDLTSEPGPGPRHFLELRDFDTATLRQMLDITSGFK